MFRSCTITIVNSSVRLRLIVGFTAALATAGQSFATSVLVTAADSRSFQSSAEFDVETNGSGKLNSPEKQTEAQVSPVFSFLVSYSPLPATAILDAATLSFLPSLTAGEISWILSNSAGNIGVPLDPVLDATPDLQLAAVSAPRGGTRNVLKYAGSLFSR